MNAFTQKVITVLLTIVIAISAGLLLPAQSAETNATEDTQESKELRNFMTNVIGLDLKKYEVKEQTANYLGNEKFDKVIKYNLTSSGSKVDVLFLLRNNTAFWCKLYPIDGSPKFTQPLSNDPKMNAIDFLEKYQSYCPKQHLGTILILANTTAKGSTFSSMGDINQRIYQGNTTSDFVWSYKTGSVSNDFKHLRLQLENGSFRFFCDNWELYKVGNTITRLDKEEAVQLAKEQALKTHPTLGDQTLTDSSFLDEYAMASLTMQNRGSFTLYPHWEILLPLDKPYGPVTGIRVLIWADTCQVSSIFTVGSGGLVSPEAEPFASQPETQTSPITQAPITVGILISGAVILVGYLIYKRK